MTTLTHTLLARTALVVGAGLALSALIPLSATAATPTFQVSANIPVGNWPRSIAVNETTHRIYAANSNDNNVTVIDSADNSVLTTFSVGADPRGIAVNETTNIIYLANYDDTISIVDGETNTPISTISAGDGPNSVAVNETTNTVYIANYYNTVSVLNGATGTIVSTITVGYQPDGVAVNETTNTIYVSNRYDHSVSVINGATGSVTSTIPVGDYPAGVAVNSATNTIFVANKTSSSVSVIDGATGTVTSTIALAAYPQALAVDSATNTVFVASLTDDVWVIDGSTGNLISTVYVGDYPEAIAVDSSAGNAYVTRDNSVSVISSVAQSRLSGADRYATSAAISAANFAPDVPVVYIANGTTFPDALSGAPVAGSDTAPVLLVAATAIPAAIQTELTRLSPGRIVVLGGTGVVSETVKTALQAYTEGTVTRLSGANRYATSAAISAATFSPDVPVAYIANGVSFPDALSGAPVAGKDGAPVLLVSATDISPEIQAELTRLSPGRIVVLGGTGVVSETVKTALQAYTGGTVTRLSGANRYATSAAISAATFSPGVPVVYIANGTTFPDALSGAPVAGKDGAPVLLVSGTTLSPEIQAELTRLQPASIVLLGGTGVVSDALAQQLATYIVN